jgi:hypothetical protein
MTYKDQFVVEVKCNGKILRLRDDFVYLPFGSEYSLYFKNLSSKRASIKVSIDGTDVLDHQSLILDANSSTELEGFLRGNQAKNRFKFIKKTKEIQEHRGDKIDDGFIRVEFAYEKPQPEIIKKTIIHEDHHHYHRPHYYWNYNDWFSGDSTIRYSSNDSGNMKGFANNVRGMTSGGPEGNIENTFYSSNVTMDSLGVKNQSRPLDDEGITVKGSEMNKDYRYTTMGELEQSEVIIIRLKGTSESSGVSIQKPMTTSSRLTCLSCGKKSRSSFKYCPNCGTYLE